MKTALPSQQLLHELFYCVGGELYWKIRPKHTHIAVGSKAGCVSRCRGNERRTVVKIKGKMYKRARLVYMWYFGTDPGELEIDHIDYNHTNDNIWNLQPLTGLQNIQRTGPGVYYRKDIGKWAAEFRVGGVRHYLGVYQTREDAIEASETHKEHLSARPLP